tara:strand:- start:154 stop:507 length:354 start_codon:yes stop_codon:yes gene_type:complete
MNWFDVVKAPSQEGDSFGTRQYNLGKDLETKLVDMMVEITNSNFGINATRESFFKFSNNRLPTGFTDYGYPASGRKISEGGVPLHHITDKIEKAIFNYVSNYEQELKEKYKLERDSQ